MMGSNKRSGGRVCFMSRQYRDRTSAGNMAKSDYEDILRRCGGVSIGLPRRYSRGKVSSFFYNLASVGLCISRLRGGDVLVLQYPVKKYFTFLCRMARLRGGRTVALIHDLGSMRRHAITERKELSRLSRADIVVAANDSMRRWLEARGLAGERLEVLGLHDYLQPGEAASQSPRTLTDVTYAGSLNQRKNSFLLQLPELPAPLRVYLYGKAESLPEMKPGRAAIEPEGFVTPGEFIGTARGAWGLVWDGASLDGCSDDWGGYLAVNTPHKCSFYLRAGLPLIVWSGSAVAEIVRREGLGICVDSLRELPEILTRMTPEEYEEIRRNVLRCGELCRDGASLRGVLERLHLLN